MRNVLYLAGIVLAVGVAVHFAFSLNYAGTKTLFYIMAAPNIVIAALGLLRAHDDGVLKRLLSVKGGDFSRGFAAAGVLFGASFVFMKTVAPPTSARSSWLARLYLQVGDPSDLRKNVTWVVAAIIIIAIAEEIVWRGLVIALLEELIGSRRAWVWSAVLYTLAHVATAWQLRDPVAGPNPVVMLAAIGAGLLWAGMARRFERILPGIFAHILFDWVVLMMFRLWGPSV